MRIRPYEITPASMLRLWLKLQEHRKKLIGGDGDPENITNFARWVTAEDTELFEVGDFGGIIFATDIGESYCGEIIARPHVFIWDKACFGKWKEIGEFIVGFMQALGIYRLVAESPVAAPAERRLIEKMGFNRIGKIRNRLCVNGKRLDFYLYDFLIGDAEDGGRDNG